MKVIVYVLCLLKFDDDNAVFSQNELEEFNKIIREYIGIESTSSSVWNLYPCDAHLSKHLELKNNSKSTMTIDSAVMGYYHHRLIARFEITPSEINFMTLREIRKTFVEYTNGIVDALRQGSNQIHFYYSYPMLMVEGKRKAIQNPWLSEKDNIFTEETTSLAFEVVEPRWWSPMGSTHLIRISIPGILIYSKRPVNYSLVRDLINAIYQYGLYEKKLLDAKQKPENRMTEDNLVKLWEHILDTMGGRTNDKYMAKLTQTNYFVALLALIVALSSVDWLNQVMNNFIELFH